MARVGRHRPRRGPFTAPLLAAWLAAAALAFWPGPGRAEPPADVAAAIERIATHYQQRRQLAVERRRSGLSPALAATIEQTDRQVAETGLAAEISRAITRDPRLIDALVAAAAAAAPDLAPGIARRLVLAFPGFRERIEAAARNPTAAAARAPATSTVQRGPPPPRRRPAPRGPWPLPALPPPPIEAEPIGVPAAAVP